MDGTRWVAGVSGFTYWICAVDGTSGLDDEDLEYGTASNLTARRNGRAHGGNGGDGTEKALSGHTYVPMRHTRWIDHLGCLPKPHRLSTLPLSRLLEDHSRSVSCFMSLLSQAVPSYARPLFAEIGPRSSTTQCNCITTSGKSCIRQCCFVKLEAPDCSSLVCTPATVARVRHRDTSVRARAQEDAGVEAAGATDDILNFEPPTTLDDHPRAATFLLHDRESEHAIVLPTPPWPSITHHRRRTLLSRLLFDSDDDDTRSLQARRARGRPAPGRVEYHQRGGRAVAGQAHGQYGAGVFRVQCECRSLPSV